MALLQIHSDTVAITKLIPLPLVTSFLIGEYSSFGVFWISIPGHLSRWHREWKIVSIQEFLSLSIFKLHPFSSASSFYRRAWDLETQKTLPLQYNVYQQLIPCILRLITKMSSLLAESLGKQNVKLILQTGKFPMSIFPNSPVPSWCCHDLNFALLFLISLQLCCFFLTWFCFW